MLIPSNCGLLGALAQENRAGGASSKRTPALSVSINGLNNYAYRSGDYQTLGAESNRNADVVVTVSGATSFQMNYRNASSDIYNSTRGGNAQWIVIGDLQVCF